MNAPLSDGKSPWSVYQLTDVQFSVVAVLDIAARVLERVEYTPYGVAVNQPAADFNGDGAVTIGDATVGSTSFLAAMFQSPTPATVDWDRSGLPPSVPFDLPPKS